MHRAYMGLFGSAKKETFHLGIYIGTGSVNAVCYALRGDHKPRILHVFLRPHAITLTSDFKALQEYVIRELQEIIQTFEPSLRGMHVTSVQVLLSSPWYFSQTRIAAIQKEKPFVAEKKVLKEYLDDEKKEFLKDAQERFSGVSDEYRMIEHSYMRVLVNGYEVNALPRTAARDVTFHMYVSLSFAKFLDGIRRFIESNFVPERIIFHTAPFLFFKTMKQFWSEDEKEPVFDVDEGMVVVDIGGEVTDITIIRKGIIEETFSFGKGVHFIVRRIAGAFSLSPKDALSLFHSWKEEEVSKKKKEKIDALVQGALREWTMLIGDVFKEASGHMLLPANIIVMGEGAYYSGFLTSLQNEQFREYMLQNRPFRATVLDGTRIRHYFEGSSGAFARGPETALLYLLAAPIHETVLE